METLILQMKILCLKAKLFDQSYNNPPVPLRARNRLKEIKVEKKNVHYTANKKVLHFFNENPLYLKIIFPLNEETITLKN